MSDIRSVIIALGTRATVLTLFVFYIATSYFFFTTISVFDVQFAELSNGGTLLDRQGFLTPDIILAQLQTYPPEAKPILWSFFILDNMLPQCFRSFRQCCGCGCGHGIPTAFTHGC